MTASAEWTRLASKELEALFQTAIEEEREACEDVVRAMRGRLPGGTAYDLFSEVIRELQRRRQDHVEAEGGMFRI